MAALGDPFTAARLAGSTAVVMHDFSIDWLLRLDSFEDFVRQARQVLAQGGGLLPDSSQAMQQGGCAANTATTLARLGVQTEFIGRTDPTGFHMMDYYLAKNGVGIGHVKVDGDLARVVALEIGTDSTNIMVNDHRSFTPFSYSDLTPADHELIDRSDIVGVFDWSLNPAGSDLCRNLLDAIPRPGPTTYLDTSDPAPRSAEIPALISSILAHSSLDHLSLNENELRQYAGRTDQPVAIKDLAPLIEELDAQIPAGLNVHTLRFSAAHDGSELVIMPTYAVNARRSTGAGDTWNGANLAGLLLGLKVDERLLFANAAAAFYVSSDNGQRPTLPVVAEFVSNRLDDLRAIS